MFQVGLSELVEFIKTHTALDVFFLILFILIIVIFKSKWFTAFLSKMFNKFIDTFMRNKNYENPIKSITDSDVTNHDIFNFIDFWVESKIPTIHFSTEYRTVVFRRYLIIYFKSHKKKISEFISSSEYKTMDSARVWRVFLNLINEIVHDYEQEMADVGIPKLIINKMKVKNTSNITLTIDLIDGICNKQFYDSENNYLKVYSVLNIIMSMLAGVISNSEEICNSINGQLKGSVYRENNKDYIEP